MSSTCLRQICEVIKDPWREGSFSSGASLCAMFKENFVKLRTVDHSYSQCDVFIKFDRNTSWILSSQHLSLSFFLLPTQSMIKQQKQFRCQSNRDEKLNSCCCCHRHSDWRIQSQLAKMARQRKRFSIVDFDQLIRQTGHGVQKTCLSFSFPFFSFRSFSFFDHFSFNSCADKHQTTDSQSTLSIWTQRRSLFSLLLLLCLSLLSSPFSSFSLSLSQTKSNIYNHVSHLILTNSLSNASSTDLLKNVESWKQHRWTFITGNDWS